MTHDNVEIIGKNVKDMYGSFMGSVVGTVTDIDGSVQSVGIDYGSHGLQQIPYEQLVVQDEVVIFIPRWRLDSQRLIREKQLTLRRLKALMDIVAENDDMKDDAEIIHEKYKSKLASLDEAEAEIRVKLETRLSELNEQQTSAKTLLFDAKVQYKSDEISEATFEIVKSSTSGVIEHIAHESAEISNIKSRIADLELESEQIEAPAHPIQESAVTYLEAAATSQQMTQTMLPEAPTEPVPEQMPEQTPEPVEAPTEPKNLNQSAVPFAFPKPPVQTASEPVDDDQDWLARMEAQ